MDRYNSLRFDVLDMGALTRYVRVHKTAFSSKGLTCLDGALPRRSGATGADHSTTLSSFVFVGAGWDVVCLIAAP